VDLIIIWLKSKFYYISINVVSPTLFDILLGTVKGWILGPILYVVFVAPLFELEFFQAYVDNTFIPRIHQSLTQVIKRNGEVLQSHHQMVKTVFFYKRDLDPVCISLGIEKIYS
jgi:hypothetical protein